MSFDENCSLILNFSSCWIPSVGDAKVTHLGYFWFFRNIEEACPKINAFSMPQGRGKEKVLFRDIQVILVMQQKW